MTQPRFNQNLSSHTLLHLKLGEPKPTNPALCALLRESSFIYLILIVSYGAEGSLPNSTGVNKTQVTPVKDQWPINMSIGNC
jgi:hypothetical protein